MPAGGVHPHTPLPLCHLVSSVSNDAGSHDAMDVQKPSNLSPSSQSIKHLVELHAAGDQQQILYHGLAVFLTYSATCPFDFPNPHLSFELFV